MSNSGPNLVTRMCMQKYERVKQVITGILVGGITLWVVGGGLSVVSIVVLRATSYSGEDKVLTPGSGLDLLKMGGIFSIGVIISTFLAGFLVGKIIGKNGRWYSLGLILIFAGVQLALPSRDTLYRLKDNYLYLIISSWLILSIIMGFWGGYIGERFQR